MKPAKVLALFSMIAVAMSSSGQDKAAAHASPKVKLWAAIGVTRPLIPLSEAKMIQVSFAVVNDGPTTVNPGADSSHLYINGVEPIDWYLVLGNGPRTTDFTSLAPGKFIEFGALLGSSYFTKPGIYSLRWEGPNFKAPEITFRVMP